MDHALIKREMLNIIYGSMPRVNNGRWIVTQKILLAFMGKDNISPTLPRWRLAEHFTYEELEKACHTVQSPHARALISMRLVQAGVELSKFDYWPANRERVWV